jgi:predicted phosphodiesterase
VEELQFPVALFSDVHGNVDALTCAMTLSKKRGCISNVFLGDAVGYLPGTQALQLLQSVPNLLPIKGNHEHYLLDLGQCDPEKEKIYRLKPTATALTPSMWEEIFKWPSQRKISVGSKRILMVHGSPENPTFGYLYPDAPLSEIEFDLVFVGNTHRPFIRSVGQTTYVNVGSVGLPRDDGRYGCMCVWASPELAPELLRFEISIAHSSDDDELLQEIHPAVLALRDRRCDENHLIGKIVTNE